MCKHCNHNHKKENKNHTFSELESLNYNNIKTALSDYTKHCYADSAIILENVSDEFMCRLAKDATASKANLRELFRKSQFWNEELQALVLDGERAAELNQNRVNNLFSKLMSLYKEGYDPSNESRAMDIQALKSFILDDKDEMENNSFFRDLVVFSLDRLAPGAYKPGKKKAKVLKAVCVALGIADETKGSEFQRVFAQIADEISPNPKKANFKLFVSINPAHFLTMSNPKGDRRGDTLTSCHSLNNTEYSYNNGCTGYARDDVTFIVFTVADPTDKESLNNRKTTRQIFAYRPGSGLMLQSRMYNTSGGTYGAQKDSALYRAITQREICTLENAPNKWENVDSYDVEAKYLFAATDFGGYCDWEYDNFGGVFSFREDCEREKYNPLVIGESGLCLSCGREIIEGIYCDDCDPENYEICENCGEHCLPGDVIYVRDRNGYELQVCQWCFDRYYSSCDNCGEYYSNNNFTSVNNEVYFCPQCLQDAIYNGTIFKCDNCGEYYNCDDQRDVCNIEIINLDTGDVMVVCKDCYESYKRNGNWVKVSEMEVV